MLKLQSLVYETDIEQMHTHSVISTYLPTRLIMPYLVYILKLVFVYQDIRWIISNTMEVRMIFQPGIIEKSNQIFVGNIAHRPLFVKILPGLQSNIITTLNVVDHGNKITTHAQLLISIRGAFL